MKDDYTTNSRYNTYTFLFNPFTPNSDQFQISPAASPEILHHAVWRIWLFIAQSDDKLLLYQFSLPHLNISLKNFVRMYFLSLGVKGLKDFFQTHKFLRKARFIDRVIRPFSYVYLRKQDGDLSTFVGPPSEIIRCDVIAVPGDTLSELPGVECLPSFISMVGALVRSSPLLDPEQRENQGTPANRRAGNFWRVRKRWRARLGPRRGRARGRKSREQDGGARAAEGKTETGRSGGGRALERVRPGELTHPTSDRRQ